MEKERKKSEDAKKKPIETEAGDVKNEDKKPGEADDSKLDGRVTKIGGAESDTNE